MRHSLAEYLIAAFILSSLCLSALGEFEVSSTGAIRGIQEERVGRKRGRQNRIGEAVDVVNDDRQKNTRIGNRPSGSRRRGNRIDGYRNYLDKERESSRAQGGADEEVGEIEDIETGGSRVKVLSAALKPNKYETGLRRLDDPSMTDQVLNHFDDNNLENELNGLAVGLDDGHRNGGVEDRVVKTKVGDYGGLGFDDRNFEHRLMRLGGDGNGDNDEGNLWSDWGRCNSTCGVGLQARWRRCYNVMDHGVCNRVTGREMQWRRCLGMDCDQETINELGGGCKDHFIMALVLGILIGIFISTIFRFCQNWCQQPSNWKMSDMCPNFSNWCGSCTNCGNCCGDCSCDKPDCATCCYGCCGCCQMCCDPHYSYRYYAQHAHQAGQPPVFYPHTYSIHTGGTMYKRPPAPLPREATMGKQHRFMEEPDYMDIDPRYVDGPVAEGSRRKQKSAKKSTADYVSFDEDDNRKASNYLENDYLEILPNDDVDPTYLTPTTQR